MNRNTVERYLIACVRHCLSESISPEVIEAIVSQELKNHE